MVAAARREKGVGQGGGLLLKGEKERFEGILLLKQPLGLDLKRLWAWFGFFQCRHLQVVTDVGEVVKGL